MSTFVIEGAMAARRSDQVGNSARNGNRDKPLEPMRERRERKLRCGKQKPRHKAGAFAFLRGNLSMVRRTSRRICTLAKVVVKGARLCWLPCSMLPSLRACAASIAVRNSEISGVWRMRLTARIGFVSRSRKAFLVSLVTSTGFSASPKDFSGEAQNGILKDGFIGNAVFAVASLPNCKVDIPTHTKRVIVLSLRRTNPGAA